MVMRQSWGSGCDGDNPADGVHVALQEVAADEGIAAQGQFEIQAVAEVFLAQRGAVERFGNNVEMDVAVGDADGGEAHTADADAVAGPDARSARPANETVKCLPASV